ncbi:MAG: Zn-ribbon domain-containing OB-fold protein [Alphaproteobacteria bacterium]
MSKPVPAINGDTVEFWRGCNAERLLYQHCETCGHVQFPPRSLCVKCHGRGLAWRESARRGHIHSFTVVHRPPTAAFKADVPYVLALVDLDEGFRIMCNLIGCPPEKAAIGLAVRITFEARGEGEARQLVPQAMAA